MNRLLAWFGLAIWTLSVVALCSAAEKLKPASPDITAQLDAWLPDALKSYGVPGLAVAVVKDDRLVLTKGYGVRQHGKPDAVDADTVFAIGSVTKSFTASLLATLVDDDKFHWDDRVARRLPGFELADSLADREATLRDLLAHRTGLPSYGGDLLWSLDVGRDEIVRRVRFLSRGGSFRSGLRYQNVMFLTAGQVAAHATGLRWDDLIQERFFTPLRMTRSFTTVRALKGLNNIATAHMLIDDKLHAFTLRNIDSAGPAGSINSTVNDLAQWLRLHLNDGTFEKHKILTAKSVKELRTPQSLLRLEGIPAKMSPLAHFRGYGLGWFVQDHRGRLLVEHGGNVDGMTAAVAWLPEEKLGVIALANLDGCWLPRAVMYRVVDAYLGRTDRDWSAEMLALQQELRQKQQDGEKKAAAARVKDTKPSLPLARYAGKYQSDLYGPLRVQHEDGRLTLRLSERLHGSLEHWHYDTFRVQWADPVDGRALAIFSLNGEGKVQGVRLEEYGKPGEGDMNFPRWVEKRPHSE